MAAYFPIRRFWTAVLVLALPLLLSQCAKKPAPLVRALSLEESAKLAEMHDPFPRQKNQKNQVPEGLPDDRLEALGDIALKNGNLDNSLINFLQVLKEHPDRYDLRYKVGVIFLLAGKLEPAKKELAEVLVHRPDMMQAHEALGMVHLQEKQYPAAIEEFRAVLAQDSQRVKTKHLLGIAFLEAGQPEKAVMELKKAVELDPRKVSVLTALSQAYLQLKDYNHATTFLKQALALAPQDPKANQFLGQALAGQKRYSEALEAFTKGGDEAQACNNIGVYYFMDGQYEEAAKCFQRAIELRPVFYDEAKINLQRALEKLHENGKASS